MEIGLFQLENLIHINLRFHFLDLRSSTKPVAPEIERLISRAINTGGISVLDYLAREKIAKDSPIILLCEDGKKSQAAEAKLEAAGYQNIYVVEGGIEGLLSEL